MFRTETQRKKLCSGCPIAKVANVIGDPCTLLVIRELFKGPKRFSDLEAMLGGISSRTLAKKLKELQENEVIQHDDAPGSTSRGSYALTPKGRGLKGITEAMRKYGEKYL